MKQKFIRLYEAVFDEDSLPRTGTTAKQRSALIRAAKSIDKYHPYGNADTGEMNAATLSSLYNLLVNGLAVSA